MTIDLRPLSTLCPADVVALHTDPRVIRQMPLAHSGFDEADFQAWLANKEALWQAHGYGPWAVWINEKWAGWGGLQWEDGDADLALVLAPDYWGYGRSVFIKMVTIAFGDLGLSSVTALLPPSRGAGRALLRWGFQPDGQRCIAGKVFQRFRLHAPAG